MAQDLQGQEKPRFPYKSDPSVRDTYCDSARLAFLSGSVLRLEFTVDRFDEPKTTDKQPKGNAVTAARIALPAAAVPELYNQLTQIISVMKQQGMLKAVGPAPANQIDEIVQ